MTKSYPKFIKINNINYPINTSYKVALDCFRIINDENISDTERSLAIIFKLFGFIPKDKDDMQKCLDLAETYLRCGENKDNQLSKRDMDLDYDWKYIVASFMSDYGIDISESDMHWYQFTNLIQGFTENSILSRVRQIRNYDVNEVKDIKEKRKIIKAQKSVALPEQYTQEELDAIEEFEALFL